MLDRQCRWISQQTKQVSEFFLYFVTKHIPFYVIHVGEGMGIIAVVVVV